jgi:hypothetical protein
LTARIQQKGFIMRRPLFTSGRPQFVGGADVDILDLRDLNTELQSYVRFVTLYAANQGPGASTLRIEWTEGTGSADEITTSSLTAGLLVGGPVKVLDRFALQGDALLSAVAIESDAIAVWGYFELDGATNADVTTRGLLPGALVSPFTYAPVILANGDPAATVHMFNADYFDLVTLDVATSINIPGDFSEIAISDGVGTTTLQIAIGQTATRIFDGIPIGAITANGSLGITLDVNTNLRAQAFGSFFRVS